jgi:LPPG:FO 2-phospho-L-lactate transferase
MADRLLPVAGVEVSATGVAEYYAGLLGGWVIDQVDEEESERIAALGIRVSVADTIMVDDAASARLAEAALRAAMPKVSG